MILLDVVMESDHAGLTACRVIRDELANPFVRILLRTGQAGAAPVRIGNASSHPTWASSKENSPTSTR